MADQPPARSLNSFGQQEDEKFYEMEEVLEPVWSAGRDADVESEAVGEDSDVESSEVEVSDGDSSFAEEESVDSQEEYRRDMEEQRLADEKNGHFIEDSVSNHTWRPVFRKTKKGLRAAARYLDEVCSESPRNLDCFGHFVEVQLPAGELRMSSEAATTSVARAVHDHAATSFLNQDTSVGERGTNSMVEDLPHLILVKAADCAAVNLHGNSQEVVGMEKEKIVGVGTEFGGSKHESILENVRDVERSMAADFIMPLSMVRDKDFNAIVDSTLAIYQHLW